MPNFVYVNGKPDRGAGGQESNDGAGNAALDMTPNHQQRNSILEGQPSAVELLCSKDNWMGLAQHLRKNPEDMIFRPITANGPSSPQSSQSKTLSPLHYVLATRMHTPEVLEKATSTLLKYVPEIASIPDYHGQIPLVSVLHPMYQTPHDTKIKIVRGLLEASPSSLQCSDTIGRSPLHNIIRAGCHFQVVELLLQRYPAAAAMRDKAHWLPIHHHLLRRVIYTTKDKFKDDQTSILKILLNAHRKIIIDSPIGIQPSALGDTVAIHKLLCREVLDFPGDVRVLNLLRDTMNAIEARLEVGAKMNCRPTQVRPRDAALGPNVTTTEKNQDLNQQQTVNPESGQKHQQQSHEPATADPRLSQPQKDPYENQCSNSLGAPMAVMGSSADCSQQQLSSKIKAQKSHQNPPQALPSVQHQEPPQKHNQHLINESNQSFSTACAQRQIPAKTSPMMQPHKSGPPKPLQAQGIVDHVIYDLTHCSEDKDKKTHSCADINGNSVRPGKRCIQEYALLGNAGQSLSPAKRQVLEDLQSELANIKEVTKVKIDNLNKKGLGARDLLKSVSRALEGSQLEQRQRMDKVDENVRLAKEIKRKHALFQTEKEKCLREMRLQGVQCKVELKAQMDTARDKYTERIRKIVDLHNTEISLIQGKTMTHIQEMHEKIEREEANKQENISLEACLREKGLAAQKEAHVLKRKYERINENNQMLYETEMGKMYEKLDKIRADSKVPLATPMTTGKQRKTAIIPGEDPALQLITILRDHVSYLEDVVDELLKRKRAPKQSLLDFEEYINVLEEDNDHTVVAVTSPGDSSNEFGIYERAAPQS